NAAPRGPNGGLAVWHGRTYTLPVGFCSLMTTDLLPANSKVELARLLASLKETALGALQCISIAQWLRTHTNDADVKQLVLCMVRQSTYCDDAVRLSAAAAIEQLWLSMSGDVLYLHGGWATLVAALQAAAVESGTTVVRECRVVGIEARSGRASHVALGDGARIPADAIVIATGPAAARALLTPAVDFDVSATEVRVAAL